MRLRLLTVALAFLLVPIAVAAAPFKAALKGPAGQPRVKAKWYYSITATDLKRKPISATVTAQLIDPFGSVYPVDYGPTQKPIVNFRFRGTFRDYLIFPPESKGFTLTARWTIKAKGGKVVLTRKFTPRA